MHSSFTMNARVCVRHLLKSSIGIMDLATNHVQYVNTVSEWLLHIINHTGNTVCLMNSLRVFNNYWCQSALTNI